MSSSGSWRRRVHEVPPHSDAREAPSSSDIVPKADRHWCPSHLDSELMCGLCREFGLPEDQINQNLLEQRQLKAHISLFHRNEITQKIPPEVLSNIFEFFTSYNSYLQPKLCSPLILGAICGRWRAIAWSTPRLWCSISINFDTGSLPSKLQLAREWLSRSGRLPLSIRITAGRGLRNRPLTPPSATLLAALIDVINGYASRWRVLDIRLPPPMLPLFHADPQGRSILHTLRIDPGYSLLQRTRVSEKFNPKNSCPSPMVVKILSVRFRSIGMRWDNVTHLDVVDFSVKECFEVLRQAPRLTNCRFANSTYNQLNSPLPESVLCRPNITSLHLDFLYPETFLQHVSFPSLSFLSVDRNASPLPAQDLVSFLRRSSPPLHHLHLLRFSDEDLGAILQILEETPSLKILHLQPFFEYDHDPILLFQRLANSPPTFPLSDDRAEFLPHLEALFYLDLVELPWDVIPDVFFSRSRRPLSHFRFCCERVWGLDERALLRIQELAKRGLSVEIKDSSLGRDFLELSCKWLSSPLDFAHFLRASREMY